MTSRFTSYMPVFSFILMAVTGLVFVLSLCASLYFFLGFLGGGRSWLAIIQAFFVCFGLGAMLYFPALILFLMGQHVRNFDPKKSIGIAAVIISTPLWIYGVFGFILKLPYPLLSLFILLYGFLILSWGALVFAHARGSSA